MKEFTCLDTDWHLREDGSKERSYFVIDLFYVLGNVFRLGRCGYCGTIMQKVHKEVVSEAEGCDGIVYTRTDHFDTHIMKCSKCGYEYTILYYTY